MGGSKVQQARKTLQRSRAAATLTTASRPKWKSRPKGLRYAALFRVATLLELHQHVRNISHFRHGCRLLARSPVFAATTVLVLVIALTASALIFSVVEAFLLRRLPVNEPERLVRVIRVQNTGFHSGYFSSEVCETVGAATTVFSDFLCQGQLDAALRLDGGAERVRLYLVGPSFFSSLGVDAAIGRTFDVDADQSEAAPAVLSHQFWQRRFRGDDAILGQTISLNGAPFVVIGVSAAGFSGLEIDSSPDIRVLASSARQLTEPGKTSEIPAQIFARLAPGGSIEGAEAGIEPVIQRAYWESVRRQAPNVQITPEFIRANRFQLEPIARGISPLRTRLRHGLLALSVGVAFLLIMASANVAGLLLSRTLARIPEISMRFALGADRWGIARQLFIEALPLALLGGGGAVALTYVCLPVVVNSIPPVRDRLAVVQPLAVSIEVNEQVLAFTFGVALFTILLFGTLPAWKGSRVQLMPILRSECTTTRRLTLQSGLVVAQVAICTVILLGSMLLIRTLDRIRRVEPGFDYDRIVTFNVDPSMLRYSADRASDLAQQLRLFRVLSG